MADALDPDAVAEAVASAEPEVIVHQLTALSGRFDMRHSDRFFETTNRLRTEGTDHLLPAGRAIGTRRFAAQSFAGWPAARTSGGVRRRQAAFDAVLARGRLRLTLDAGHPSERIEAPEFWQASWLAARDLLQLLVHRRDRIKACANPECVLWFADTTRSDTRRWCSMTGGCGSRLKARRHHDRQRGRQCNQGAAANGS